MPGLKRNILLTLLLILTLTKGYAAVKVDVVGELRDSIDNQAVSGAIVELLEKSSGKTLQFAASDENGCFCFEGCDAEGKNVRISLMGYCTRTFELPADGKMGVILMIADKLYLESSKIEAQALRSSQNGDTLSFNAAAYRVMMGADSEALISKMPGISVTDSGVDANGREVRRLMVDGQEFFGDDVLTALKNIPADMISQIEVINKLSDAAQLTGVDDGEGYTAINVVTKADARKGSLTGRFYGAYGIPDKYMAGGNLNYMDEKQTATVVGMGNNISKFNFTSSDLVGASSDNDKAVGDNFKVKPLSGISSVAAAGVNYSNKWINGSYFFNRIGNSNLSSGKKTTLIDDGKYQYSEWDNDFGALNYNHRLTAKISFSPSRKHSFIIRPNLEIEDRGDWRAQQSGFWKTGAADEMEFIRKRLNEGDNDRFAIRAGGNASYRYAFNKKKRTLSVSLSGRYYKNSLDELTKQYNFSDEETDFDPSTAKTFSSQSRNSLTEQGNATASVIYTDAFGKSSRLSVEYKFNASINKSDKLVYLMDKLSGDYSAEADKRQSGSNKAEFYTNTVGVRYNYSFRKMTVALGLSYQNVGFTGTYIMPGESLSRTSFNNAVYKIVSNLPFNQDNTLRFEARGYTVNPGVNNLQSSVNLANASNIRAGNPDIRPTYFHDVKLRYIHTDKKKGMTLSLSLNWLNSPNYICDSLVINRPDFEVVDGVFLGEGNQYAKPVNLSGYNRLNGKFSFGFPIKWLYSNFNLHSTVSMSVLPGMINGDRVPVHRNFFDLGARMDSNISENVDFTIAYSGRYTMNEYSGKFGKSENNYLSQMASGKVKFVFWKGVTVSASVRYVQDINTDGKYNDQFVFCDLFLGKRLFRNQLGEISIGVNDILNDGVKRFQHSISVSGVTDIVNQGIGRYFSVQFVYHLRAYNLLKRK